MAGTSPEQPVAASQGAEESSDGCNELGWDGLVDGLPGREFNELGTEAPCCHVLRVLGAEEHAAAAADEQDRAVSGEPIVPVIPVEVLDRDLHHLRPTTHPNQNLTKHY
ncbi:hypothetical protein [Streptomyces sp. NPDC021622]|uniref:hypothetical protein n=1 Tax=Streptomyces sp. NPDC021622 TaxID=3155013 RepID=UPI0033C717AD